MENRYRFPGMSVWQFIVLLMTPIGLTLLVSGLGCGSFSVPVIVTVVVTPTVPGEPESGSPAHTPAPGAGQAESHAEGVKHGTVTLDGVTVLTDTVVLTLTVRAAEPAAYLFDTPLLRDGQGGEVTPLPDSLEAAHFALLDAITQGQAKMSLEFSRPEGEPVWTLVFNPLHEPGDYVAPRVELEVEP